MISELNRTKKKVEAVLRLKPPENTKELKSFLGAIQHMAKLSPKPRNEQTDCEIY